MACHHHHRNIHHGEINMLASPGFFALEQGSRKRKGAHGAGCVINRRCAEFDRVYLRRAGAGHDARCRLDYMIIRGLFTARPTMAKGRDGAIDQPRIELQQILIAQAQSRKGTRAKIFHQHISAHDQLTENLTRCFLLQIKRHAALV